ncbi:hypothetical protein HYDPIDRAFT_31367 [Hydnomerulius pinastri MD-312]|uniref:Uncharacterized protein n=1 Tax=Hydnomerulius pinastri MD-312 TaxID=994086 RepID=A0A0C9WCB2_9AGAM|nr:hypothetical protein HYDPIDRAFT_31367 [Hydnomerulius pinastri MD-312]
MNSHASQRGPGGPQFFSPSFVIGLNDRLSEDQENNSSPTTPMPAPCRTTHPDTPMPSQGGKLPPGNTPTSLIIEEPEDMMIGDDVNDIDLEEEGIAQSMHIPSQHNDSAGNILTPCPPMLRTATPKYNRAPSPQEERDHLRTYLAVASVNHSLTVPGPAATKMQAQPPINQSLPPLQLIQDICKASPPASSCIWSSQRITLEACPFHIDSFPFLLLSLNGFMTSDIETVLEAVQCTWDNHESRDTMVNIIQFHDIISHSPHFTPHLEQFLTDFISSVRIERIDCKGPGRVASPHFNIFAHSLTMDPMVWTELHTYLMSIHYPSVLDGVGVPVKLNTYAICHSVAHPKGLCPFLAIPAWHGPKLESAKQQTNANNEKGKGRRN